MKIIVFLLCAACVSCGGMIDRDWGQCYNNNSDYDMYFYLHYYDKKNVTYPAYDDLINRPYLHLIKAKTGGGWSMWPTKFSYGTLGHMYAFSRDTLVRYSWEEIIAEKKFWFAAMPCRLTNINFPEEFDYMGN